MKLIKQCNKCKSKLIYQGELAVPGKGKLWKCAKCNIEYIETTILMNLKKINLNEHIMTASECI
jgi:predicted nucleic-acid-binding Zn-ribbon protein